MLKKILKYTLYVIIAVLVIGGLSGYFYLKSTAPEYEGERKLDILTSTVDVTYDQYGIPHILAQNDEDAYRALGYAHAQDRLFQMEMIRRLSSGKLAEVLGERLIRTDKFFRTLGIRRMAQKTADLNFKQVDADWKRLTLAYLEGVNAFVESGNTPIEFSIMGMPKEKFEPVDVYCILGYMGLGFSKALKDDPIMEKLRLKLGMDYFEDWVLDTKEGDSIGVYSSLNEDLSAVIPSDVEGFLEEASLPLWYGSNSWVLSADRSASGSVLLANDTHIGISQPSVWYEAHLSFPGFDFYGNHLAGVPFAVIGHSKRLGWGLTIFPFDGIDLYRERTNPDNANQVWEDDHWSDMEIQTEVIKVKDGEEVIFERKVTRHGPVINDVASALDTNEVNPISFWWNYLHRPTANLEAIYGMNVAKNIDDVRESVSKIDFIGLNVLYGDVDGNIAHWGAGRIPKRAAHVNPKFILDGASGKDELLGFYDFSENPQTENPVSGYIASANHDPGMVGDNYYHGYYCPPNRLNRIERHLSTKAKWTQEELKTIQLDEISDDHKEMARIMSAELLGIDAEKEGSNAAIISALNDWDGGYELEQVEPTIFTKLLYHTMAFGMRDEIGEEDFETLQGSYIYKGSMPTIMANMASIWWDDIHTKEVTETRKDAVSKAFVQTMDELKSQLGDDWKKWTWDRVHTITHKHPLGAVKVLEKYFNVGPYPVSGGNDVPNKMMYPVTASGEYKVNSSPALRILIDFADVHASESINPTGQSGNVKSPHYKDQAEMFNTGIYRPQLMDWEVIGKLDRKLILRPD